MIIQSLLQDTLKPAVSTLLDTIDSTMNSNTLLLKGCVDQPLTPTNDQEFLTAFLQSLTFRELLFEADRLRGWSNYSEFKVINDQVIELYCSDRVVKEPVHLTCSSMSECTFARRLNLMMQSADYSPYKKQISKQRSQNIVEAFFHEVFGAENWPLGEQGASDYWQKEHWTFRDIKPDFLYSTGYYDVTEQREPSTCPYFDGGNSDTCTFFYREALFYLLLTNGSP